jgi:hypothetical protein
VHAPFGAKARVIVGRILFYAWAMITTFWLLPWLLVGAGPIATLWAATPTFVIRCCYDCCYDSTYVPRSASDEELTAIAAREYQSTDRKPGCEKPTARCLAKDTSMSKEDFTRDFKREFHKKTTNDTDSAIGGLVMGGTIALAPPLAILLLDSVLLWAARRLRRAFG